MGDSIDSPIPGALAAVCLVCGRVHCERRSWRHDPVDPIDGDSIDSPIPGP